MNRPNLQRASSARAARSALHRALLTLSLAVAVACSPGPDDGDASAADGGSDAPANLDTGSNIGPGGLSVLSLTPNRGPLVQGDEVDIAGTGFFEDAKVFFGEEEAEVTFRGGTTHVFVKPPERTLPGRVDVRVENPGVGSAVVKNGYTYLSEVGVDTFAPAQGPALGGTLITVHGTGFSPGDRVLVGQRAAFQSEVIDSSTIVALTPAVLGMPAGKSRVDVTVSVRHSSGVTVASGVFTYGRTPRVTHVEAALVPMQGADVTLHGEALDNADTVYIGGAVAKLADGTASSSRGATVPARAVVAPGAGPGAVALLITGPFGHSTLAPALAYVDGKKLQLFGVTPAHGTTAGGSEVRILADLAGATPTQARFGDATTAVSVKAGSIVAQVPKAAGVGMVDVTLVTSAGDAKRAAAFRYWAPLSLDALTPATGPTAGGQTVTLTGAGLSPDCTVRFGSWEAQVVAPSAGQPDTSLTVTTPPGAPGPTLVRVTCGGQTAQLPYGYDTGGLQIDAVLPAEGATGGGTLVTIHGSGFTPDTAVYFDGQVGKAVQWKGPGTLTAQTPAHDPGAVAVDVVRGDESDTLIDGFTYFSPANPQGGTYGSPLAGTLNVTVLNIYTLQPIDKAFVQVGQPGTGDYPSYSGYTDASGQIVFSGTDLQPPVTVSAAKPQFSASSIANFEVGNATLLLFPWVPPSPGGGGGGPGLPLATLKGRVLDIDKVVLRPPTTCLKPSSGGPLCDFCKVDADCSTASGGASKTWACVQTGGVSARCFNECDSDTDCDDNKDFVCTLDVVDGKRKVCQPSLGIREITCKTSTRGLETVNPDPGPGSAVDEKTGDYAITSRLDELAVYCVGGYRRKGVFLPTSMGVRRHIFPQPGQTIEGLDIKLDIPLKRTLPVRLDHPQPFFPANNGGDLTVEGWLELGSDGYIPVARHEGLAAAETSGTGVVDELTLPAQPLTLPQTLTDTSYTWRAVVDYSQDTTPAPMEAGTLHASVVRPGDDNVLVRTDGTWQEAHVGIHTTLVAALPGEATDVLLVARDGRIFRGSVDDPYTVWLPPVLDPYAQPVAVLAAAGTPTDATVVGAGGLIRRLSEDGNGYGKVVVEKSTTDSDLRGVCHGPLGRVAVGDKGALQVTVKGTWTLVPSGTSSDLRGVVCTPGGAVAVGDGGVVVRVDLSGAVPSAEDLAVSGVADLQGVARGPTGTLWAVGRDAQNVGLLLQSTDGKSWKSGLPAGTKGDALPALRRVAVASEGTLVLADRDGGVWWRTALGLTDESPQRRNVLPLGAAVMANGDAVVVGEPGLWLGPFLRVPTVTRPIAVAQPDTMKVEWSVAPGPSPSVTRVHLDGAGFPFWWLYVDPKSTSVALPNFKALDNIDVFVPLEVPYVARVDRIFAPELSINAFSTFDLEFGDWRSWATNGKTFSVGQ